MAAESTSSTPGDWQTEINTICKQCPATKLSSLKNSRSDEERIKIIVSENLTTKCGWITQYFRDCHNSSKNQTKSLSFKLEGNKLFQKRLYQDSISKYTKAILYAPTSTEILSQAFGNRSAALFHLKSYKECLTDIAEATSLTCPQVTLHKLYMRWAHCLHKLGHWHELQAALQEAENVLKGLDIDGGKKDLFFKEVQDLRKEVENSSKKEKVPVLDEDDGDNVPELYQGAGSVLIQASSAVTIQFNEEQGRFLTATEAIHSGDTLIVEKPFAAVLLPEHYSTHCHHCFCRTKLVFPCRRCVHVVYCSPQCADQSWLKYHHLECDYLKLLQSVGIAHLSLRVVLVAGLNFLLDFRKSVYGESLDSCNKKSQIPGLDETGQYRCKYNTVYHLLPHSENMAAEDLLQYTLTAELLLQILQDAQWFQQIPSAEEDCSLANQTELMSLNEKSQTQTRAITSSNTENFFSESVNKTMAENAQRLSGQVSVADNISKSDDLKHCDHTCDERENEQSGSCRYGTEVSCRETDVPSSVSGSGTDRIDHASLSVSGSGTDRADHAPLSLNGSGTDRADHAPSSVNGSGNDRADHAPSSVNGSGTDRADHAPSSVNGSGTDRTDHAPSSVNGSNSSDTELYVGGLLLRHILQLVCNAHAITELQRSQSSSQTPVEETSQVRVATAIYPTASLMNHSCDPTIISSFHKDTLIVRAIKDVAEGGEIFNCYGPHCKRMTRDERQRCLREQYFFTCRCPPCIEGEQSEKFIYSYKCQACESYLVPSSNASTLTCSQCSWTSSVDLTAGNQADQLFQTSLQLLNENKLQEAFKVLEKCHIQMKSLYFRHNIKLSHVRDCLAKTLAMAGDFTGAASYLEGNQSTIEAIFGHDSVEVANELQKLSEVLISAHCWSKALKVIDRALDIFTLHYGKSHDSVKEMSSARNQILEIMG